MIVSHVYLGSQLIKQNTQEMLPINCPICLDALGNDYVTLPSCQHSFHRNCITKWLQLSVKQTCPTCGYLYGINKGRISRCARVAE